MLEQRGDVHVQLLSKLGLIVIQKHSPGAVRHRFHLQTFRHRPLRTPAHPRVVEKLHLLRDALSTRIQSVRQLRGFNRRKHERPFPSPIVFPRPDGRREFQENSAGTFHNRPALMIGLERRFDQFHG